MHSPSPSSKLPTLPLPPLSSCSIQSQDRKLYNSPESRVFVCGRETYTSKHLLTNRLLVYKKITTLLLYDTVRMPNLDAEVWITHQIDFDVFVARVKPSTYKVYTQWDSIFEAMESLVQVEKRSEVEEKERCVPFQFLLQSQYTKLRTVLSLCLASWLWRFFFVVDSSFGPHYKALLGFLSTLVRNLDRSYFMARVLQESGHYVGEYFHRYGDVELSDDSIPQRVSKRNLFDAWLYQHLSTLRDSMDRWNKCDKKVPLDIPTSLLLPPSLSPPSCLVSNRG